MTKKLSPVVASPEDRRRMIREKTLEGIKQNFPIETKKGILEVENLNVHTKEYGPNDMKQRLMKGGTLHERVSGTLVLKDKNTGRPIEKYKNYTVANIPYLTTNNSFIVGGNEYAIPNQLRLKPGVYTRTRANGELEASFNLAKGRNFRLSMQPDTGKMRMELGASKIPLHPVLTELGVSRKEIEGLWGRELENMNMEYDPKKREALLKKVYAKLKRPGMETNPSIPKMKSYLKQYFEKETSMDPVVTKRTLGRSASAADPSTMLVASKKLLDVHRGAAKEDDRDSLEFKTIHSVDDFFKERLQKDGGRVAKSKLRFKVNQSGDKPLTEAVPRGAFTKALNSFLTNSNLSSIPTQINPVEILDATAKITSLGEGGISSDRSVPMESRQLHNSHLGILDPSRTPETFKAGIDVRAGLTAHRDEEGNLYALVKDRRSGRYRPASVAELQKGTLAFSGQKGKAQKSALQGDRIVSVKDADVDFELPDPSLLLSTTTSLVPLINTVQGNRVTMGSKFQAQALPLVEREAPYVQAGGFDPAVSMEKQVADMINPISAADGVVEKIDDNFIYIRPDKPSKEAAVAADNLIKVPYHKNYPYASKTYINDDLNVRKGSRVSKGQQLGESNYTKDGQLAIGKNLSVGYMAYYGKNSNDAIVISESAANKLTSEHMYKKVQPKSRDIILDKKRFVAEYGMKFTKAQLNKLDDRGIVKPGQQLDYGDPIVLVLQKTAPTPEQKILGNFSKSLMKPYEDRSLLWEKMVPAESVDVIDAPTRVTATIKTREKMKIGDKITNRYGGKGIVSEIVDDEKMVQDESGKPIDLLFTSAGVVSRVNPGQIIEAALGKVAEKTGKPIVIPQFEDKDMVQFAKGELKKHGLKDKETVYDPIADKKISNIFVGRSYIHKLFKNTETNYAARGVSSYDINEQPTRGGDQGAKSIGKHEFNALLAHNARNVVKDAITIKGGKSDEFWRAYELGLPPPPTKTPFATQKFTAMMRGAGIDIQKKGNKRVLAPLTDAEIVKQSSGKVKLPDLKRSQSMLINASNMQPEKDGLFDPVITGGVEGTKWSHMELPERVLNPVFEEPVRRLLGTTKKGLNEMLVSEGGDVVRNKLNEIDLRDLETELRAKIKKAKGASLNNYVKQLKYVRALRKQGKKAGDAYTLKNIPVIPPKMRPIVGSNTGGVDMQVSDANYLYRDVGLAASALNTARNTGIEDINQDARRGLNASVSALFGLSAPVSPQLQGRSAKGFIEQITGTTSPKTGYAQKKLLKRRQDLSGRATIAPDVNLDMDTVGIPEDMLWTTYGKFIIKGLVAQGYTPKKAADMVEERAPAAKAILNRELKNRPVFINRAPTLHRFGFMAAYPTPVKGKTITFPSWLEEPFGGDFDGDTVQVHVPVTDKAVAEARDLTMSKILFSDKQRGDLMALPKHEAMMGVFAAANRKPDSGPTKTFKTKADAMRAYKDGKIGLNTKVKIQKK